MPIFDRRPADPDDRLVSQASAPREPALPLAGDDQQQRSSALRWLLLLWDCERVLLSVGGAAHLGWRARLAGVVSTAGS
jgi:hypothetical protein